MSQEGAVPDPLIPYVWVEIVDVKRLNHWGGLGFFMV